jgi:hypothetical protein
MDVLMDRERVRDSDSGAGSAAAARCRLRRCGAAPIRITLWRPSPRLAATLAPNRDGQPTQRACVCVYTLRAHRHRDATSRCVRSVPCQPWWPWPWLCANRMVCSTASLMMALQIDYQSPGLCTSASERDREQALARRRSCGARAPAAAGASVRAGHNAWLQRVSDYPTTKTQRYERVSSCLLESADI